MGIQLRPARHQIADLKQIVELGAEKLAEVQARLSELTSPTLNSQGLVNAVCLVVGEKYAEPLVRQLLSLSGVMRQTGGPIDDVMHALGAAIANMGGEYSIDPADWESVEPHLKVLVEHKNVRIAATALELAYDYANLLQRTRILTDVRPIYNKPADRIEGAVISFTMRLKYSNADGEHDLSIALDEEDIETLCEQCQRAIVKAMTARSLMADSCKVPVLISGEAEDA